MGRAGRPKDGVPPGLQELEEHGVPEGWHDYWHGSREHIPGGSADSFSRAGYKATSEGFVRKASGTDRMAARERWIDPGASDWSVQHRNNYKPGLVAEDYIVEAKQDGDQWQFAIRVGEEEALLSFSDPDQGILETDTWIRERRGALSSAWASARFTQAKLQKIFEVVGATDFSKQSPAGEALLAAGVLDVYRQSTYMQNKMQRKGGVVFPSEEDRVFEMVPDLYGVDVSQSGQDWSWELRAPNGKVLETGTSETEAQAQGQAFSARFGYTRKALDQLGNRYVEAQRN